MAIFGTARNNPALTVTVARDGGPKTGTWYFSVRGRIQEHARGEFPCRDGGNYHDTRRAAKEAVARLLGRDSVALYPRFSGSAACSSFA